MFLKFLMFYSLFFANFRKLPKIFSHLKIGVDHFSTDGLHVLSNIDLLLNRASHLSPQEIANIASSLTLLLLIPLSITTDLSAKMTVKIKDLFWETDIDTFYRAKMASYLVLSIAVSAGAVALSGMASFKNVLMAIATIGLLVVAGQNKKA